MNISARRIRHVCEYTAWADCLSVYDMPLHHGKQIRLGYPRRELNSNPGPRQGFCLDTLKRCCGKALDFEGLVTRTITALVLAQRQYRFLERCPVIFDIEGIRGKTEKTESLGLVPVEGFPINVDTTSICCTQRCGNGFEVVRSRLEGNHALRR